MTTSGQPVQWGPPQDHAACNEAVAAAGRDGAREALLSLAAELDRKADETATESAAHDARGDQDAAFVAYGASGAWRTAASMARVRAQSGSDGDSGAVPVSPDGGERSVDLSALDEAAVRMRAVIDGAHVVIGLKDDLAAAALELERVARIAIESSHGAPLPPADRGWRENVTCGSCGYAFGTNCDENDIDCPECEARRCPCCGNWFGGTDDA